MQNQRLFRIFLLWLLVIPGFASGQWTISPVDTLTTHAPGDTFAVDLRLTGSGPAIDALGFDFQFPDSLVQPDSVILAGSLLDSWMFKNVNRLNPNTFRIAGFTLSGAIQPSMNGVLARFRFIVQTQQRRTGIFRLLNFADDLSAAVTRPDTFSVFANASPQIQSQPITQACEDAPYTYSVNAVDPDQDSLTFRLSHAPFWLSIDPVTGQIAGRPTNSQVGDTLVAVEVSDPFGGKAQQEYTLTVINVNDPPFILSKPVFSATQHTLYQYQVVANDPDAGDVLRYSLQIHPHWLQINSASGLISGIPGARDVGDTTVTAQVADLAGAVTKQEFTLTIIDVNDPPRFLSRPDTTAVEDSLYSYQVQVEEFDSADTLSFRFELAPVWLRIDAKTGLVQGIPTNENVGDTLVSIQVSDRRAGEARQQFRLHVLNVNDPPFAPAALLQPAWQETTSVAQAQFVWRAAHDPDRGDVLTYSLEVFEDELLTRRKLRQEAIPDSFLAFAGIPNSANLFENNQLYFWRVQTVDLAGATSAFTSVSRFKLVGGRITEVDGQNTLPGEFRLLPLFPNPFNPAVTIPFQLPRSSQVQLQVFNLQGQLLRTIINETRPAGTYQLVWDGLDDRGQMASSGIYWIRFGAEAYHAVQKVTLIR
jgi:hypothetical protein